jgi:hypothetical protein
LFVGLAILLRSGGEGGASAAGMTDFGEPFVDRVIVVRKEVDVMNDP